MTPNNALFWVLQDNMRNILLWVTINDPFASNLRIDDNWNPFDYPWIYMVPILFFLYIESRLCNPKSSVFTYTYHIPIVIQQTRTAESEVLHTTLPNWLLTLLQNCKTTESHDNRLCFQLVYRIQKIHIVPVLASNSGWTHVTSNPATHQGPNSILRPSSAGILNTPTLLGNTVTTHMIKLEA
jgi:hypothetical protein